MRTRSVVPLLALLALGCPSSKPQPMPNQDPVLLTVEGWDQPIEVQVGQTRTIAIHVTNADGSPATGYTFYAPTGDGFTLEHPSDGEERLTIAPKAPGWLHAKLTAIRGPKGTDSNDQDLTFFGGPTDELLLFPRDPVLVVGETRALGAIPLSRAAGTGKVEATLSSDALAFQSDAPGVVTVDADGALKALAAGTAHVTATAGGKTASVTVTVQTGTLAPPGDERIPYEPVAQASGAAIPPVECGVFETTNLTTSDKVVLDARSWPTILTRCLVRTPTSTATVWGLLRWTGSGFGFELLRHPDALRTRNARVVRTTDGALVVMLIAEVKTGLLTRPADAVAGGWKRQLVFTRADWADASTGQLDLAWQSALAARPGGGVFVARWQPFDPGVDSPTCQRQVTLLALHDGTVERTHAEFAPTEKLSSNKPCAEAQSAANGVTEPMQLLRPPAGEHWPRVFVTFGGAPQYAQSHILDPSGDSWTATAGGQQTLASNQGMRPVGVAVARREKSDLVFAGLGAIPLGTRPEVDWALMFLSEPDVAARPFALELRGKLFGGGGFVDTLGFITPNQALGVMTLEGIDSVHLGVPAWWAPVKGQMVEGRSFWLTGAAADSSRLAFASRGFLFSRVLPPVPPTGDETLGRVVEAWVLGLRDVAVADDDTLYAVGRASASPQDLFNTVARASGLNQPWSALVPKVGAATLGMFWRVFPVGAKALVSDDALPSTWRVLSSTDHLTTATEVFAKPLGAPHADFISRDGLALAATLGTSSTTWVVPHVDGASPAAPVAAPWTLPATWLFMLSPTSVAVGQTGGIFGYANSSQGGAWQVVAVSSRSAQGLTQQWGLAARRFTTEGAVAEEHLFPFAEADVPLSGNTFREKIPDVGSVIEGPDGALVLQSDGRVWRLDPGTNTSSSVARPGAPSVQHVPMARVGAQLALLSSVAVPERVDVTTLLSWSKDCTTWTTVPFPRAQGAGQQPQFAVARGDALLAIVAPGGGALTSDVGTLVVRATPPP